MPEIRISGLASGLPPDLVDRLIEVQRAPLTRLADRKVEQQTRLAAVQDLNVKLLAMKVAMEGMDAASDFEFRSASSSDTTFVTASAGGTAAPGNYTVTDVVLAERNQLRLTTGVNSKTDPLTPGTFAFTYGTGTEQQITISGGETLSDLVDKVNALDAGVAATIINDGSKDYLVLSGAATGAANAISLTVNTTLTGFEAADFSTVSTASDATFKLDGLTVTGASNTFTGAVEGLTIDLAKATIGEIIELSVSRDTIGLKDKVKGFVDAYNAVATLLNAHSQYNQDTGQRTVLFGDSAVRGIESQLRRMITTPVLGLNGTYSTLAELGITTSTTDGSLGIDDVKLSKAVDTDFEGVGKLFYEANGVQGFAKQAGDYLTAITLAGSGLINGKEDAINAQIKSLDQNIELTQRRVSLIETRIRARFVGLETIINSLNNGSSGALQTLANMNNRGNNN